MLGEERLLQFLCEAAETAPVIGHRAASVRNDEAQRREILEQIAGQALHESGRVGIEVMRAGRVERRVAAGRHVDHRRDVVLDHLLVDRIPEPIGERRRVPHPARRIRIQVDRHIAVLVDALLELGDARPGIDARRLRQHRCRNEVIGKELRHPIAELVADRRPCRRHVEVADVMRHEARARTEDREVAAPLVHQLQLVHLDRFAELVVADRQLGGLRHFSRIPDAGDLPVAPDFQRLRCGRVMTVTVDDHSRRSSRALVDSNGRAGGDV